MIDSENRELERRAVDDPLARRQLLERQRRLGLLLLDRPVTPAVAKLRARYEGDGYHVAQGGSAPGRTYTTNYARSGNITFVDVDVDGVRAMAREVPIVGPAIAARFLPLRVRRPYSPPYIDGLPPDPR